MADTSKITLKQLKDAMNKAKNYTDNEIAGITGVSKVEPEELDMPKVFFYGTALPTTKDNVNLTMDYISNTAKFSSFVKLKCQGTSSMSYAKKNFTVAMFSDESRTIKLKKDFKGWGAQSKFCLKANYVDTTHTRNISGARIAYDMVQSRPDSPFKQQLLQCPRNGAVDGFPIKVYFNGEFYGIYTWNIPKDGWMFNMDEGNANHMVLCAEKNNDSTNTSDDILRCEFRKEWDGTDGNSWSIEFGTYSDALKNSFNRCVNFVMTATDEEFKANIGDYFDLYSLLDYYCFSYLTAHIDGLAKNMLMATYDGVIWGATLYDMDSIYGADWQGSQFKATNIQCPEQYQDTNSLLWQRIESCFPVELYARYLELRQGALSLSNIIKHVEEIYDVIPDRVFADEKAKWTSLPGVNTNTMTRFRNYMRDRAVYVDAQMEEIGTRVPCTGIVLSADTLSFTTTDTQTLTATVEPTNTTDVVTWSVSPTGIVTVNNGVVTPVTNGNCTITATCGSYSATCTVTVSGLSESGGESDASSVATLTYSDFTNGKTIDNTGNIVDGSVNKNVTTNFIDVNGIAGIDIKVENTTINSDSHNILVAEYDSNKNFISSNEYIFDDATTYFYDNYMFNSNTVYIKLSINFVNELTTVSIYDYSSYATGLDPILSQLSNMTAGKRYTNSGVIMDDATANWYADETYIPFTGDRLYFKINNDVDHIKVSFYDNNKTFISYGKYRGINNTTTEANIEVLKSTSYQNIEYAEVAVTNIAYISICVNNPNSDFTVASSVNLVKTELAPSLLYELPQETTFNGTSDYIDTGVALFPTDQNFTIALDVTAANQQNNRQSTLFHCMHEEDPWPGISMMSTDINGGFHIPKGSNVAAIGNNPLLINLGTRTRVIITKEGNTLSAYSSNGSTGTSTYTYTQVSENLLIGAYQETNGAKGRYFVGTVHDFKIYNKVFTSQEKDDYLNFEQNNISRVFKIDSTCMNTADNTLTDNIAGISATLTGNPTVSDNQIVFTANDKFSFDLSSLSLNTSNRTLRVKFTPTSLNADLKNVLIFGETANTWNSATSVYISDTKLVMQHGSNNFANMTVGDTNAGINNNRLSSAPTINTEYEIVISENVITNEVRWFVNGTLVQNGISTLFNPLYLSNIEGSSRFIGNYSLIEIYNGYCNDYTGFTNMVNNASSGGGTDIYATAEYAITEPRTFNGTSDYIDTGIQLFDTAKDFAVYIDYTPTAGITQVNNATVLHCVHEVVPYRGLTLMHAGNDYFIGGQNSNTSSGYAANITGNENHKFIIQFANGVISHIKTINSGIIQNVTLLATAADNPYVQATENLLLGCYQDASGTKGRYWNGTINKFAVWFKRLTDDEIQQVFDAEYVPSVSTTYTNGYIARQSSHITDGSTLGAIKESNSDITTDFISCTSNDVFNILAPRTTYGSGVVAYDSDKNYISTYLGNGVWESGTTSNSCEIKATQYNINNIPENTNYIRLCFNTTDSALITIMQSHGSANLLEGITWSASADNGIYSNISQGSQGTPGAEKGSGNGDAYLSGQIPCSKKMYTLSNINGATFLYKEMYVYASDGTFLGGSYGGGKYNTDGDSDASGGNVTMDLRNIQEEPAYMRITVFPNHIASNNSPATQLKLISLD